MTERYEGCCLVHRRRVRWLANPMWWHHADDLSTCARLLYCPSPHGWKTHLDLARHAGIRSAS